MVIIFHNLCQIAARCCIHCMFKRPTFHNLIFRKWHFPCIFWLSVNFHYPEMKIEFKKYLKIRSFPVISGNFRKMTRKNAIFYPLKKPWGIKDSPWYPEIKIPLESLENLQQFRTVAKSVWACPRAMPVVWNVRPK